MRSLTCVSVVACVARKPCPCPSYSRRRDRINLGLWRSLYKGGGGVLVGVCQAGWQKPGRASLDGQEIVEDSLMPRRLLCTAFHLAPQCIGLVMLEEGSMEDPDEILLSMPIISLSSPLGLVMWSP